MMNIDTIIPHRKKIYKDIRCLLNEYDLAKNILDEEKHKEYVKSIKSNRLTSLFSKKKSDDYWNGLLIGASLGIKKIKNYFVSNDISEEKFKKLLNFLNKEGISIMASNSGLTFINSHNTGKEYIKYEINETNNAFK